ncbi:MAG: protein translocase subunit SecF [Bryobacteraceae bacterium]|nr:protein translocase subunit SecF [Bryobacteraceae bacterium]
MHIFKDTNYDFLGKKWPFIIFSLVVTALGIGSLVLKGGPEYGLDFRGGALIDVRFSSRPPVDEIRKALGQAIKGEITVQEVSGANDLQIGVELKEGTAESRALALQAARGQIVQTLSTMFATTPGKLDFHNVGQDNLVEKLREPFSRAGVSLNDIQLTEAAQAMLTYRNTPPRSGLIGSLDELASVPGVTPAMMPVLKQELALAKFSIRNVEVVSPKVTGELRNQALLATLYALAAMLIYIAFRFEWTYGLAAVVAVFHDTIMTVGLFSLFNKPIDLTVVAALLTLVGYSMNDTIVVFDRIRENQKLIRREAYDKIVNLSLNQTLSRTTLTAGLTFLTCLALYLFGGPVLHGFAFALVVGIIVGTYSSIFIAAPIVIYLREYLGSRKQAVVAAK